MKREKSIETRSALKILVGAAAACLVLGVLSWLIVESWLVTGEVGSEPHPPVFIADDLKNPAKPSTAKESIPPHNRPDFLEPEPSSTNDELILVDVQWFAPPITFPEEGITAPVRTTSGEVSGANFVFFSDHTVLRGKLPDGKYSYGETTELFFPASTRIWIEVVNGLAAITQASKRRADKVTVYYLIPIRLVADLGGGPDLEVLVRSQPESVLDTRNAYSKMIIVKHMEEQLVHVPALTLDMSRAASKPQPSEVSLIQSSLGDRHPEPNELVQLSLLPDVEVAVSLIERSKDDFVQSLSHVIGIDAATIHSSPDSYVHLTVQLRSWGGRNRDVGIDVAWPVDGVLQFKAPSVPLDGLSSVTVLASPKTRQRDSSAGITVAIGQTNLAKGLSFYELEAHVITYDWSVEIVVLDTENRPRPDFLLRVRAAWQSAGEVISLGPLQEQYTDSEGRFRFSHLPASIGSGFQLSSDVRIPRELNPDLKAEYWFSPTLKDLKIVLVVDAALNDPLVFHLPLPEKEGPDDSRLWQPCRYFVVPQSRDTKFDSDVRESVVDDAGRLITRVREPGEYSALLLTPQGEVFVTVRHNGKNSADFDVPLEPQKLVKLRCLDTGGSPLTGCIIFTSAIDPVTAWSVAMCENRGYTRHLFRQTTRRDGRAEFPCQYSRTDPANWMIFHKDYGLFAPLEIRGSVESGFELAGVTQLAAGSVELSVDATKRRTGLKYRACITSIYTLAEGQTSQALVGLGDIANLGTDPVTFKNLPIGTYLVTIILDSNGNFQPAGPGWTKVVEIKENEILKLTLPD